MRRLGIFAEDKFPGFVLADCGTGERHATSVKTVNESQIRLLPAERQQEPLTAHTDSFRAHEPLE